MPATSTVGVGDDPYNLESIIKAQDQVNVFKTVLADFRGGHQKPNTA